MEVGFLSEVVLGLNVFRVTWTGRARDAHTRTRTTNAVAFKKKSAFLKNDQYSRLQKDFF